MPMLMPDDDPWEPKHEEFIEENIKNFEALNVHIHSFAKCCSTTGWILIKSRRSVAWGKLMFIVYRADIFYWINWNYMR